MRFWASVDVIHLTIGGARIKSLRSHLSTADLIALAAEGATPAGPPPLPLEPTAPRSRSTGRSTAAGSSRLAGHQVLAAEILGGRPVLIRIEPATLMFLDPETRELLRTRSNPLTRAESSACRAHDPQARHRDRRPSRFAFSAPSARPA